MNRAKAKNIEAKTAKILQESKNPNKVNNAEKSKSTESPKEKPVEITNEICQNLVSEIPYRKEELVAVGSLIFKTAKQNPDNFSVATSGRDVEDFFQNRDLRSLNLTIEPLAIIYKDIKHKGHLNWILCCITQNKLNHNEFKDREAITVLFIDSNGGGMPEELKNALENILRRSSSQISLKFLVHQSQGQGHGHYDSETRQAFNVKQEKDFNSGPMTLRNLEIILQNLLQKNLEDKQKFINGFANYRGFCKEIEISTIKKDFAAALIKENTQVFTKSIDELESNTNDGSESNEGFKKDLREFIKTCVDHKRRVSGVLDKYKTTLENCMREIDLEDLSDDDSDSENDSYKVSQSATNLKKAHREFYNSDYVKESLAKAKKDFEQCQQVNNEVSKENIVNLQAEIQYKYPKRMQIFTSFCQQLSFLQDNPNLDYIIEKLCQTLGLDTADFKQFFEYQKCEQKEEKHNVLYSDNKIDYETLITSISGVKPANIHASKTKPCLDTEIKTLEKVLSEIEITDSSTMVHTSKETGNYSNEERQGKIAQVKIAVKSYFTPKPIVMQMRENFQKIQTFSETWKLKTAPDIYKWATSIKTKSESLDINEAIAIMDRANELVTDGHRLRIPQIISVLTFLQDTSAGKLCQIQAGEGKTTVVSLLATLKILQGEFLNVDVITSNAVLAREAVLERKTFYNLFGITVTTNNIEKSDKANQNGSEPRPCYSCQVVYGAIGTFQFDYLRNVRRDREFSYLILDEVDSMLIDSGAHIAKISTPLPGMESLKYFYLRIWQCLEEAETELTNEIKLKMNEKNKELSKIKGIVEEKREKMFKEYQQTLILGANEELKNKIKSKKPLEENPMVPEHLKEFANNSLEKWINNAIYAKYSCHENHHYLIKDIEPQGPIRCGSHSDKETERVVVPVDYANTGITLKNTIWSHALHQSVQIKHNLRVTSESLTSTCISNYGYIRLYKKISGMTGTLGSTPEQELLSRMYNVTFARIPTFKTKKFTELPSQVTPDEFWTIYVARDAITEVKKGRAVLIISQTIAESSAIVKCITETLDFLKKPPTVNIRTFLSEDDSNVLREAMKPGDIVAATNIAGRGADFRTSKDVESKGGLHVILSYYPDNERVKDQAFFRTSRQGQDGTARIIMRNSDARQLGLDIPTNCSNPHIMAEFVKLVVQVKIHQERERVDFLKKNRIAELYFEDTLHSHFHKLCGDPNLDLDIYVMKDLKEYWAFWLEKQTWTLNHNQEKEMTTEAKSWEEALYKKSLKAFSDFRENPKTQRIIQGNTISHNPYYAILKAEGLLRNRKFDDAKTVLEAALKLTNNPHILYAAYVKLFDLTVEKGGVLMNRFKDALAKVAVFGYIKKVKNEDYKDDALKYLEKAESALNLEITYLQKVMGVTPSTEESPKQSEEKLKQSEEKLKQSEENPKNSEEKPKQSEEKPKQSEDNPKKSEEKPKQSEEKPKQSEEKPKQSVENPKQSEEKPEQSKEKPKKSEERPQNFIPSKSNVSNNHISKNPVKEVPKCNKQIDVSSNNAKDNAKEPEQQKNLMLEHLYSRLVALQVFHQSLSSLRLQINDSETTGLTIGSRVDNYFQEMKPKNDNETALQKSVFRPELSELSYIGLETMYGLNEVHDAPTETIVGAQIQILAGLATYATGLLFPPYLPVAGAFAGTLIAEGLLDIAMELINYKRSSGFDAKSYVQGKVISYGISICTMGLSAILSSAKIMQKAANACRKLANILQKSKYMKSLCKFIAAKLNRLATYFENLVRMANAARQSKKAVQTFSTILTNCGKSVAMGVTGSLVMERIVTATLDSILQEIKPVIKNRVSPAILTYSGWQPGSNLHGLFKNISREKFLKAASEVMYGSSLTQDLTNISTQIALGVARHFGGWQVAKVALQIDALLTGGKFLAYVYLYRWNLYNFLLKNKDDFEKGPTEPKSDEQVLMMLDEVVNMVTDNVYTAVSALAGKVTHAYVVGPLINKAFEKIFSSTSEKTENEEQEVDSAKNDENPETENVDSQDKTVDETEQQLSREEALKILDLPEGSSDEDIQRSFQALMVEAGETDNQHQTEVNLKQSRDILLGNPQKLEHESEIDGDKNGERSRSNKNNCAMQNVSEGFFEVPEEHLQSVTNMVNSGDGATIDDIKHMMEVKGEKANVKQMPTVDADTIKEHMKEQNTERAVICLPPSADDLAKDPNALGHVVTAIKMPSGEIKIFDGTSDSSRSVDLKEFLNAQGQQTIGADWNILTVKDLNTEKLMEIKDFMSKSKNGCHGSDAARRFTNSKSDHDTCTENGNKPKRAYGTTDRGRQKHNIKPGETSRAPSSTNRVSLKTETEYELKRHKDSEQTIKVPTCVRAEISLGAPVEGENVPLKDNADIGKHWNEKFDGNNFCRFHLVSAKAGGFECSENIILATGSFNTKYYNKFEKKYLGIMSRFTDKKYKDCKIEVQFQTNKPANNYAEPMRNLDVSFRIAGAERHPEVLKAFDNEFRSWRNPQNPNQYDGRFKVTNYNKTTFIPGRNVP